jgi:hypothetical protein
MEYNERSCLRRVENKLKAQLYENWPAIYAFGKDCVPLCVADCTGYLCVGYMCGTGVHCCACLCFSSFLGCSRAIELRTGFVSNCLGATVALT